MDKHDKYEVVKQAWFEINEHLRNNKQDYIEYLKFSSKMYKQPYSDAVLVFQQDRNATKIAEYKKWGRLGRYVRRGSHGVAVFGKNHTCRYLYDVTQTGGKELPEMWTLTDRNTTELLNTLNNRYNINAGSVKECIEAMTANSINSAPIAESVQNAISQMGLDTKQAEVYRHSLDSVVQFVVSQRCNLSGKINLHADVDVSALDLIKNARDMILFSRAVQHAAKDTLFEIEKEVIAIDHKNEALDNAKTAKQESTSDRVDDILQDLIKLKFSQEQILALKQAVVAAAQNGEHNIRHWVSVRYSPDELRHISSLLSDYYAQSVIEQTLDPKGILNDYYTYVNELNGRLKLSDMFSHHDYSDEQKAMLQQGFSEGISITVLNEVDERLTVDEIKTFFEMFHQAVDGQIDPHDVQIYLDKAVIEHSKKNVQAVEAQDNSVDTNSIGIVKGEKSFAEQVDDVLAGNANRYNDLKVCDTPQILLDVGCEQLPMFYTKRHLHDALKPKGNTGESIHYHGLNAEQIKKMPMLLENPVIIYDSLSRNDSIIIVTSELDNEKMPIIAAIKPNGKAKYDLELVESNFVMSFHGRNNFENQINRAVEQNKVLYYNKEKSQELFSVLGLQLSKGLNILDSNLIIHQSRNIVKGTQQENIEYKNNSVTQQDIDILRSIEPRKSVLNFTAEELQLTKDWAERFENDIHKKSPFYRAANGEWRDKETTRAEILSISNYNVDFKKICEDIKNQTTVRGVFTNNDTAWNIQISRNGLEDSVKYGFKHKDTTVYNMLYQLPKLVENSILLDSFISERNNSNKAYNTAFMHKLYGVCRVDDKPYLAKITVEEFANGQSGTLMRMYNFQDIKIGAVKKSATKPVDFLDMEAHGF